MTECEAILECVKKAKEHYQMLMTEGVICALKDRSVTGTNESGDSFVIEFCPVSVGLSQNFTGSVCRIRINRHKKPTMSQDYSSSAYEKGYAEIIKLFADDAKTSLEIDYTISISYGDDDPDETGEASPTEEDMAKWIKEGMERDGFTSVNITCRRQ